MTAPDAAAGEARWHHISSWYHTIELPDGTTTPGFFDNRPALRHVEWPAAVRGGRCLDVGTFDGFWAFELEKRDASEVFGLDVPSADDYDWQWSWRRKGPAQHRTWSTGRAGTIEDLAGLLGSRVQRILAPVYELDPEVHGTFDVVMCGDILLHLRDPILALERIRSVCRGELLVVETLDPLTDLVARPWPVAQLLPLHDQWWRPNGRALQRMVEAAGFEITWRSRRFLVPFGSGAPYQPLRRTLSCIPHGLAAGTPTRSGVLHMALRARPLGEPPLE